jgi:hypothetical protein
MLGFLFGNKGKFKLKDKMEVELQVLAPEGPRSYFCQVLEATPKRATFSSPREGSHFIAFNPNDIIRCIAYIDDDIYEVNVKVLRASEKDFEALISKNVNSYQSIAAGSKKGEDTLMELQVPLDFRAITTSHLQRAESKAICREYMEMVTNLPVPEGTGLKLIFKVPDSPAIEMEGTSEKSLPLEEDSRKSKTRIVFEDQAKAAQMVERVTRYMAHYRRRMDRRREMEEKGEIPKTDERLRPSAR